MLKRSAGCVLFGLMLIIFFIPTANGKDKDKVYYVSPLGSDEAAGSAKNPFRTIQHAANIVNPGDTVIVKDGVYASPGNGPIVEIKRSGRPDAWITFRAENRWGAVLDGNGYAAVHAFHILRAAYIRIEGFDMGFTSDDGVHIGESHDIYLCLNKIHNIGRFKLGCMEGRGGRSGVYAGKSTYNLTFDSNTFYTIGRLPGGCPPFDYNHDHGLYLKGSYCTIVNNVFYDIKAGWGVQLQPDGRVGAHIKILGNKFYGANPKKDGQIILYGKFDDILIKDNVSRSPKETFIKSSTPENDTNIYIENNTIYGASSVVEEHGEGYKISGNRAGLKSE
jgi:hypothetical protein